MIEGISESQCGDSHESLNGDKRGASYDMYFAGDTPTWRAGLYGDAMTFTSLADYGFLASLYSNSEFPNSKFGALPFTIRCWIWVGATAYYQHALLHFINYADGGNGYMVKFNPIESAGVIVRFTIEATVYYGDGGAGYTIADGVEHDAGEWHRIRFWFNPQTLAVGYQVDLETEKTGTVPSTPDGTYPWGFTVGGGGAPVYVNNMSYDEVGVWHNSIWTTNESIADYNGGAGVTWPAIKSTIAAAPMLYYRMDAADWELSDQSDFGHAPGYSRMRNLA